VPSKNIRELSHDNGAEINYAINNIEVMTRY
jgi:hypothetical protein